MVSIYGNLKGQIRSEEAVKMKKLLLLVVVIGLLMSGIAGAEGAWGLWTVFGSTLYSIGA